MPVETTTKQMALTNSIEFMSRVQAMTVFVAGKILNESINTPHHSGRATYAQKVINGPAFAASTAAPQIVMGVNVVQTTVYDEQTKTSTCSITDPALESQVLTLWNALAGLDTPVE